MDYTEEELIPIVGELAAKYTSYEHSSVTYETAQMLMDGVLYCIHELGCGEAGALAGRKVTAREAYQQGSRIVKDKVCKLRELYDALLPAFRDYGVQCLKDTMIKGIPAFLLRYDARFVPQKTLLTLDYPVLEQMPQATGVDAVLHYVQCICLEQKLLALFGEEYVTRVLNAYHEEYESLVENICEVLLPNLIGHVLLKKPLREATFTREEYIALENPLSGKTRQELTQYMDRLLCSFTETYLNGDKDLLSYLQSSSAGIARRIENNLAYHCLERIF